MTQPQGGQSPAPLTGPLAHAPEPAEEMIGLVLLEDDADFASALQDYLNRSGFDVTVVARYRDLAAALAGVRPGLLLADQFVAGIDVSQMLTAIRSQYDGPVVMLTGNDDPVDRVICLERGADDFIVKAKAGPREVLARIRAVLRRATARPSTPVVPLPAAPAEAPAVANGEVMVDGWVLSDRHRTLANPAGETLRLTGAERDAMWLLMSRCGRVVPREDAIAAVLHRPAGTSDRSFDNLVSRCRRLVERLGGILEIETVRGIGYKLNGIVTPAGRPAAQDPR